MTRILLIGNYPADQQHSMLRYTMWLAEILNAHGDEVTVIQPRVRFGHLAGSSSGLRKWLGYIDKYLVFPIRLAVVARRFDLIHICDHSNAPYQQFVDTSRVMITCHDLIAIKAALAGEGPKVRWTGRLLQRWILRSLEKIRFVCCVSKATADDVAALVKSGERQIQCISNPCFGFAPMTEDEASEAMATAGLSTNAPFILHVGGNLWYKNRSGVVAIFRHLMEDPDFAKHELVLAGPGLSPALQKELERDPIADHVRHVVDPSDRLLNALYSRAAALLFPSLQEGFGWPIVEAQSCGCPVITTDREPMLEVGGAAAFYVDPSDPKAAAWKIATGWSSIRSRRAASIENAARFSETLIARQYLQLYNSVQERLLVDSR